MEPLRRALLRLHHERVHLPRARRVAAALAEAAGPVRSVLDVGCGDGRVARDVATRLGAPCVLGVDTALRAEVCIEARPYDGEWLPFEDDAFDAVLLADVLHHAKDPLSVLRECLRVAPVVALKDHVAKGPASRALLLAMDLVGNAGPGVEVRGVYYSAPEWVDLVERAGGRIARLAWPLRIHDLPFRLLTRDALQFAARIERVGPAVARGERVPS